MALQENPFRPPVGIHIDEYHPMIQSVVIIKSADWQSWEHEDMAWVSKSLGQGRMPPVLTHNTG